MGCTHGTYRVVMMVMKQDANGTVGYMRQLIVDKMGLSSNEANNYTIFEVTPHGERMMDDDECLVAVKSTWEQVPREVAKDKRKKAMAGSASAEPYRFVYKRDRTKVRRDHHHHHHHQAVPNAFLRVWLEDMQKYTPTYKWSKTVSMDATALQVSRLIAEKFGVQHPDDYALVESKTIEGGLICTS